MSGFGKWINLAAGAANLLDSFINGGDASLQAAPGQKKPAAGVVLLHMEDGKKYRALSKYIVKHPKRSLEQKSFNLQGPNPAVYDDGEVSFNVVSDPTTGDMSLWAFNTDPVNDYYLSFGATDANCDATNPTIILPRANQPGIDNKADITQQFNEYTGGDFLISPVQITSTPTTPPSFSALKAPLPLSTLLGNYAISVIAAPGGTVPAPFALYSSSSGNVDLTWTLDPNTSSITGYSVTNTTSFGVNLSLYLNWNDPAYSTTINVAVPSAPNGPAQTGDIPSLGRPINSCSASICTSNTAPSFVKATYQDRYNAQKASGMMKSVKMITYNGSSSTPASPSPSPSPSSPSVQSVNTKLNLSPSVRSNSPASMKIF